MSRRVGVAALCLVAALAACNRRDAEKGPQAAAVAEMDKPVPDYAASSLDGKPVSLGALKGKVVLLNVWATWCAPCREEIPYLESLHERFASRGLALVGVSVDARGSEKSVADFRDEFKMSYAIWLDPDERVQTQFRALGVPSSYLIDRAGVMRWKRLGALRKDDPMLIQALELALQGQAPGD